MNDRFTLSPAQQEAWTSSFGRLPRGKQTGIANALQRKARGTDASWRTQLSAFFKGEERGLRAFFSDVKRLKIVAEELDLSPQTLERSLSAAKGATIEDDLLETRLPGFEDRGPVPILTAFFPPRLRQLQVRASSGQSPSTSAGGSVQLEKVIDAIRSLDAHLPRAFVITGTSGSGRGPLAKAVAAVLEKEGRAPQLWSPGTVTAARCTLVFDFHLLPAERRSLLLRELKAQGALLIATTSAQDRLLDLPKDHVLCALGECDPSWAMELVEHIQRVARTSWEWEFDTTKLVDWLEDDPYSVSLTSSADGIGILARHVADGGQVPVQRREFVRLSLRRWARSLRQRKEGAAAIVLETCGEVVLRRLAVDACLRGSSTFSVADVARELVRSAEGLAGRDMWEKLGAPGMLGVLESWVNVGVFVRAGDDLRLTHPATLVAALGIELPEQLHDEALVRAIVLNSEWHGALTAAIEITGNPSPIIEALDRQPPSVRCLAFPAYTHVLLGGGRPSDVKGFESTFISVLRWWSSWPADTRNITMTLALSGAPESPPQPEALIEGLAPLVALGLASRKHDAVLRQHLTVDSMRAVQLDPAQQRYLQIMKRQPPGDDDIALALMLGAPFQSDSILDSAPWRRLPGLDTDSVKWPFGITREEYAFWWREVAVPRLQKEPDRDARIAGTREGCSIRSALTQVGKGARIWSEALLRRIEGDDPAAAVAFVDLVAFALEWAGLALATELQSMWGRVASLRKLEQLREAVATAELPEPSNWRAPEMFKAWFLTAVATNELRERLWTRWMSADDRSTRVPWRNFLEAGLQADRIVDWALSTIPEDAGIPRSLVKPAEVSGGGIAFITSDPEEALQIQALDFIVKEGTAAAVISLMNAIMIAGNGSVRAYSRWYFRAWMRLQQIAPDLLRKYRIQAAIDFPEPEFRQQILADTTPRVGEAPLWTALRDTSASVSEWLIRHCQVGCALLEGEDPGPYFRAVIEVLEAFAKGSPTGQAAFNALVLDVTPRSANNETEGAPTSGEDNHLAASAEIDNALPSLLGSVGVLLRDACLKRDVQADLVRRVLHSEHLLPQTASTTAWWSLAIDVLGASFVLNAIMTRAGHLEHVCQTGLLALAHADDVTLTARVFPLMSHPELGSAARLATARRVLSQGADRVSEVLERVPLIAPTGGIDTVAVFLMNRLVKLDPEEATRTLSRRLRNEPLPARANWWTLVIPELPNGPLREVAIREYLSAQPDSSAHVDLDD
jgi:hypothetical protein